MTFNFANVLNDAARLRPNETAVIIDDSERYTFADMHRRAAAAAGVLAARGIGEGSRIGLRLPNIVDFIPYYFALLGRGAMVFLLNPGGTRREVEYVLKDGRIDAIVTLTADDLAHEPDLPMLHLEELVAEEVAEARPGFDPVQLPEDRTALVLYTSGSTGDPKGVELSHIALLVGPMMNAIAYRSPVGDVLYAVLPLYHVYGITEQINAATILGNAIVLRNRFRTADLVDAIERFRVTVIPGVPTMLHAIINADLAGRDLSSVRQIASGGAPISPEHIARVRLALPNAEYVEGYGLTETAALGTQNGSPFEFRFGSVGKAVQGLEVQIFDPEERPLGPGTDQVGEIAVRGPGLMSGYLGRPEETARTVRNGWIFTGDLGYLDEDGYLFITGRSKDLIIRGGFNVYPVEVEHVLEGHASVSQAAVVGVPHQHYGEEVVAFVVPACDPAEFSGDVLIAFAMEHLTAYKYPRHVIVLPRMPLGPTNKIDKIELKRAAAQQLLDAIHETETMTQKSGRRPAW